jgi:hypothetical protein
MKKSVVIIALGLAVSAVSSFAQGQMTFNSYLADNSLGVPIYFSTALGGGLVGAGYEADLAYSLTPFTDTSGNGALNPLLSLSGAGTPSVNNVVTPFGTSGTQLGYFQGALNFQLTPYTTGTTVYFEVLAYQISAGSYAASTVRGHSAVFSSTLIDGPALPQDIGLAGFATYMVASVPEPTTLALAGLGGLASLVAFRRKQS